MLRLTIILDRLPLTLIKLPKIQADTRRKSYHLNWQRSNKVSDGCSSKYKMSVGNGLNIKNQDLGCGGRRPADVTAII